MADKQPKQKLTKEEKKILQEKASLGRLCDDNCVLVVFSDFVTPLQKLQMYQGGSKVIYVDTLEDCLTFLETCEALEKKATVLMLKDTLPMEDYCREELEQLLLYYGPDVDIQVSSSCYYAHKLSKYLKIIQNASYNDYFDYIAEWEKYCSLEDTEYDLFIKRIKKDLEKECGDNLVEYLLNLTGRPCIEGELQTTHHNNRELDKRLSILSKELIDAENEKYNSKRKKK